MDHHTALKLVPLGLACLKTWGCTDFDPLNTKESDVLPKMCFLKNSSSYSFETCTTVISMPENCRVQWVLPSKYKGKWHYSPKCVFSKMDHHTALKLVPLGLACLKSSGCTALWPSKYKGKWCYSPKCVFSEMDHHTALIPAPLQSACLKTSGCTDFDPINTKESDLIAQNAFSQKWIIQIWNLYHWDWHAWKPQGALTLNPLNTKESDVIAQNVFSQKWIIIQLWYIHHCYQHA